MQQRAPYVMQAISEKPMDQTVSVLKAFIMKIMFPHANLATIHALHVLALVKINVFYVNLPLIELYKMQQNPLNAYAILVFITFFQILYANHALVLALLVKEAI
jgi:hypothetical protein